MIKKIKEWKERIIKKANEWENSGCHKAVFSRDGVIIKKNNWFEFLAFFFCFTLPFILITSIFLILIIYTTINKIIIGLIFYVSFLFPFYVLIILGFREYLWNKEIEWNINYTNQNITLSRIKPNIKQLKKFSFSDVKYLLYEGAMTCYIISFHISRFKNPVFFAGEKGECVDLGKILAKNIETDFYYRNSRVSKKYKIEIKKLEGDY